MAWVINNRTLILNLLARELGMDGPERYLENTFDEASLVFLGTEILEQVQARFLHKCDATAMFILWDRDELLERLKRGEQIDGFRLEPDGKGIRFEIHDNLSRLDTWDRPKLEDDYFLCITTPYLSIRLGHDCIEGKSQHPVGPGNQATDLDTDLQIVRSRGRTLLERADRMSVLLPVGTRTPEGKDLPPDEAAANAVTLLQELRKERKTKGKGIPPAERTFALLHEVAEMLIAMPYLTGPDRRWFCEGAANRVAWSIMREFEGEACANQTLALQRDLTRHARYLGRTNLSDWTVRERERQDSIDPGLQQARYAFATRAVFMLAEKGGPELLPRTFRELRKRPPGTGSLRTVASILLRNENIDLYDTLWKAEHDPVALPMVTPGPIQSAPHEDDMRRLEKALGDRS